MSDPVGAIQSIFGADRFEVHFPASMASTLIQASIFSLFAALSVRQIGRQKAWFFWVYTGAITLEATGCFTQAYLAQDETNHSAYLVAFASLTLAPALLALSTITAFFHLQSSTSRTSRNQTSYRTLWIPERVAGPFCVAIQLSALVFFLLGVAGLLALHSPTPIQGREGALARLTFEAQALACLRIGWVLQLVGLTLFTIVARGSSVLHYLDYQGRAFYSMITWVALLNLARTLWKVSDFMHLEPESLDLIDSGLAAWLVDTLPLILAFALHPIAEVHPRRDPEAQLSGLGAEISEKKQFWSPYENPSSC